MDRRRFLTLSAATAAYSALPLNAQQSSSPKTTPGSMRFVFFTDTHIQPELSATEGTAKALAKIKSLKPEFCIQGGDHAFDIAAVPRERSQMLLDLYQKTEHTLDGIPVHHVIGNHDVYGRDPSSGVELSDPLYGKKAFEQRFDTKTYRSFDHKGYHFILLDSIQITPTRDFDAFIDPAQLAWLRQDLAATSAGTPIVIACHVPLVSAVIQYTPTGDKVATAHGLLLSNTSAVLSLLEGHNVIAVLQGHTHINETVYWRNTPFITSGAVSGNWWHGTRWGTPEGFTVLELDHGAAHWHYESYGWTSPDPTPDPLKPILHPRAAPLPRSNPDLI
jgi:Icc protein